MNIYFKQLHTTKQQFKKHPVNKKSSRFVIRNRDKERKFGQNHDKNVQ